MNYSSEYNRERISALELIIPFLQSNLDIFAGLEKQDVALTATVKSRLDEYRLEYKERTGREYNLGKVVKVV